MSDVSETWGEQITRKALIALAVFLVLVRVYIGFRYERDMAIAALAALFFDLTVTAGVYSIVGFEVTPATVIGMLTILGFSLYDSVVVFDKVEENTRGVLALNKRTYAEQANLAINQTLMRSINTTFIGILPVLGLMVVACGCSARDAEGPRVGAAGRHDRRRLLVAAAGHPAAGRPQACATAASRSRPRGSRPARRRGAVDGRAARRRRRRAAGAEPDLADDAELARQLRRERPAAAAASAPARTGRRPRREPGPALGKAARPTGKRHR